MGVNRIVTKNFGRLDPQDINSYIACDGLAALIKAVKELNYQGVIREIKDSGLLGRGGAGFPTGKKWELTRQAPSRERYLVCNADEGEVGTFKDRHLLANDPFSLLEGMAIASFAIGAQKAFIYLRAEYACLLGIINQAIEQIRPKINQYFKLDIEVCLGAGAYVCGEETALIESIEGKRADARFRPPYPPSAGLWGKPTVINNVETLMNVPRIIHNGAQWFQQIGTQKSKGTKVFSVSGDVQKSGIYELVMGSSLKELLELAQAADTKMVQIGGAAGRILAEDKLDTPLSYETVLGAGGIVVFDRSRDAVEVAFKTMEFFREESCGKCAPCREGTRVMLETLDKFNKNEGRERDLANLEALSNTMRLASLCGLGQTAPNAVVDTLKDFRAEYLAKIKREKNESNYQTERIR